MKLADYKMGNDQSPCRARCKLDKDGIYCLICQRTAYEIANWPNMTEREKMDVEKSLRKRKRRVL